MLDLVIKLKTIQKNQYENIDELLVSRTSILIWINLIYVMAMILQNSSELLLLNSMYFTIAYIFHALLHWSAYWLARSRPWLYFLIQCFLILTSALLLPIGSPAVLIGLLPILIGQSIGLYDQKKKIICVFVCCMLTFFFAELYLGEKRALLMLVPLFMLMLIVVIAYAIMFFQQVHILTRTQTFLRDLEKLHRKVEELTLANDLKRMVCDLHDTLTKEQIGLIMQLEVADVFISQGNIYRFQKMIQLSMDQARRTLGGARQVNENLRLQSSSELDFLEALTDELQHFTQATGIEVFHNIKLSSPLSRKLMKHSLQIISECLTLVVKYAKANKVWVIVDERNSRIQIEVKDNGTGFDKSMVDKEASHHGILLLLHESARLMGGQLRITSLSSGTRILMEAPI
jgi:two-component system, NarL family, sensor histidine kinase YdfH